MFDMQCMWRHTSKCIKHVTPGFLCIFCFMKKTPIIKFYGVYDHFKQTFEVAKS